LASTLLLDGDPQRSRELADALVRLCNAAEQALLDEVRRREVAEAQLLDAGEVCRLLSISKPTLWRYVKQERVPQPIRLGSQVLRWRLRDIKRFVHGDL
jgi:predicted DNA-binding transcriptional regulator AlpA